MFCNQEHHSILYRSSAQYLRARALLKVVTSIIIPHGSPSWKRELAPSAHSLVHHHRRPLSHHYHHHRSFSHCHHHHQPALVDVWNCLSILKNAKIVNLVKAFSFLSFPPSTFDCHQCGISQKLRWDPSYHPIFSAKIWPKRTILANKTIGFKKNPLGEPVPGFCVQPNVPIIILSLLTVLWKCLKSNVGR